MMLWTKLNKIVSIPLLKQNKYEAGKGLNFPFYLSILVLCHSPCTGPPDNGISFLEVYIRSLQKIIQKHLQVTI